jgi:hypothetical protein
MKIVVNKKTYNVEVSEDGIITITTKNALSEEIGQFMIIDGVLEKFSAGMKYNDNAQEVTEADLLIADQHLTEAAMQYKEIIGQSPDQ